MVEGEKGNGCYVDAKFIDKYKIGINFSKIYFDYTIDGETKKLEFKVLGSFAMAEDLIVDDKCSIFIDEKYFLCLFPFPKYPPYPPSFDFLVICPLF